MRDKIITGLVFVAAFIMVLIVLWVGFPDFSESQHFAGISGALGGLIGGILGVTYLRRLHDERFTQIENRSAKNAFIFLLIVLPIGAASIGTVQPISVEMAVGIVLIIWAVALAIFYISLVYHYKK